MIVEAISAGADGYLLKKTSARELRDQLRSIVSGGAPLTAEVARTLVDIVRASPVADAPPPARLELSPREQEALRCLVRGMTYQQVADELGVSLDTVRTFIRRVYKKLQVHSVAEAVQRAIRERLV